MYKNFFISLILCAGGKGSRMGTNLAKQYLLLQNKPIVSYSFELFDNSSEIDEIVIVCSPEYRSLFKSTKKNLLFADPGMRRQDSVYSGLCATSSHADFVLTHDAARPFLERQDLLNCLESLVSVGAAALATAVVNTIKESDFNKKIVKTVDRSNLWEMQTPQGIRRDLFFKAFDSARSKNLECTDEMSLVENLGAPASLVPSSAKNMKITTAFDLAVAQVILQSHAL